MKSELFCEDVKKILSDIPAPLTPAHVISFALRTPGLPLAVATVVMQAGDMIGALNKAVRREARSAVASIDRISAATLLDPASPPTVQELRDLASVSWQLELCMWLGRGGNLTLSPITVQEAIVGVRVGMFLAAFRRKWEVIEQLLAHPPDWIKLDMALGERSSHRSSFVPTNNIMSDDVAKQSNGEKDGGDGDAKGLLGNGGGWQFLVDVTREEAEALLAENPVGAFLIRPSKEAPEVFSLSFVAELKGTEGGGVQVQHAIIRLEEKGFRCGSYGPFAKLWEVLEQISSLLPHPLAFGLPPPRGSEAGDSFTKADVNDSDIFDQPSPNAVLLRALSLRTKTDFYAWEDSTAAVEIKADPILDEDEESVEPTFEGGESQSQLSTPRDRYGFVTSDVAMRLLDHLVVKCLAAQIFAIAECETPKCNFVSDGFTTERDFDDTGLRGHLKWLDPLRCFLEMTEARAKQVFELKREVIDTLIKSAGGSATKTGIEARVVGGGLTLLESSSWDDGDNGGGGEARPQGKSGDSVLKDLIKSEAVQFRPFTLANDSTVIVVAFSKLEAARWLAQRDDTLVDEAKAVLEWLEAQRIVEEVKLGAKKDIIAGGPLIVAKKEEGGGDVFAGLFKDTSSQMLAEDVLYRLVDPWEVKHFRGGRGAFESTFLGRNYYDSTSHSAQGSTAVERKLEDQGVRALYARVGGGSALMSFISSLIADDDDDDDDFDDYKSTLSRYAFRNAVFNLVDSNARYYVLVQAEILDLKNTAGGVTSNPVFATLRLSRAKSIAPCSARAKTLDCATTKPTKIKRGRDGDVAVGWGSAAAFKFPLPPSTRCDGTAMDASTESLFSGPPTVVQMAIYEKRLLGDLLLGKTSASLESLTEGDPVDEWLQILNEKVEGNGPAYFVRLRVSLRFELMHINY